MILKKKKGSCVRRVTQSWTHFLYGIFRSSHLSIFHRTQFDNIRFDSIFGVWVQDAQRRELWGSWHDYKVLACVSNMSRWTEALHSPSMMKRRGVHINFLPRCTCISLCRCFLYPAKLCLRRVVESTTCMVTNYAQSCPHSNLHNPLLPYSLYIERFT
jgi:hypothetical protein